jgi:hypothetical protein
MKSKIISFYLGKYRPPSVNKTIDEMWRWDNAYLEGIHGYLTWLFPTRKRAMSIDWQPITDEEIQEFKTDPDLRKRVLKSFYRMLWFYGFEIDPTSKPIGIRRASTYNERKGTWVTADNHHFHRISRILQSLMLLGFKDTASMFLEALTEVYSENKQTIGVTAYEYWTLSVSDEKVWNGTK